VRPRAHSAVRTAGGTTSLPRRGIGVHRRPRSRVRRAGRAAQGARGDSMNRALATAIGVGVIAVSVVLGARLWRAPAGESSSASPGEHAGMPMPNGTNGTTSGSRPAASGDVVTLTPEMVARAGIKTAAAVRGTASARLHLPGVVQPNAYKNVEMTSL